MKKTIKDYDVKSKTVIVRCDLNVPMENNQIKDDTKIKKSLKTIKYLIENNAKVIILSHLGKINQESDKKENSLYQVSLRMQELLGKKVQFSKETRGETLNKLVENLKDKEILLIENTRFEDLPDKKESSNNQELAKYWASLADIYVNDAYGSSHRAHASTVGIANYIESAIGFLVEEEITKLNNILEENTHPFVIIMGGKKVSDKIKLIENLIKKCDKLIIGGAMAYTFLKGKNYNVGKSIVEEEYIKYTEDLLKKYKEKIILPVDSLVAKNENDKYPQIKNIEQINNDDIGYDIGPKTIDLIKSNLKNAKRVIINGPLGLFENSLYENGTKEIYKYLIENNIKTLIGGGDSAHSVNKLGYQDKFYHISTGGGATLKYLEGSPLPGIEIIDEK